MLSYSRTPLALLPHTEARFLEAPVINALVFLLRSTWRSTVRRNFGGGSIGLSGAATPLLASPPQSEACVPSSPTVARSSGVVVTAHRLPLRSALPPAGIPLAGRLERPSTQASCTLPSLCTGARRRSEAAASAYAALLLKSSVTWARARGPQLAAFRRAAALLGSRLDLEAVCVLVGPLFGPPTVWRAFPMCLE